MYMSDCRTGRRCTDEDLLESGPGPGTYLRTALAHSVGSYNLPSCLGPQYESTFKNIQTLAILGPKSGPEKREDSEETGTSFSSIGPGSYGYPPTCLSPQGVRFGRSQRPRALFPSEPEPTPGCAYTQDSSLLRPSSRVYVFPRAPRSLSTSSEPPRLGPGTYEVARSSLSGKASTFGLSHEAYRQVFFPGCDRERLGRTSESLSGSQMTTFREYGVSFARSPRSFGQPTGSQLGPGQYRPKLRARCDGSCWFGRPSGKSRLSFRRIAQLPASFWV
jgi:hypothetical protein